MSNVDMLSNSSGSCQARCKRVEIYTRSQVGWWDGGTVGRWDGGTVGRWDGGTVGRWDGGTV